MWAGSCIPFGHGGSGFENGTMDSVRGSGVMVLVLGAVIKASSIKEI